MKGVLKCFGFSDACIALLESCWNNNWFSVLINGEALGYFNSLRGLRQGDPISLGLFVIAAEVLSQGFKALVQSGACYSFNLCSGCPTISLFVDDTLLKSSFLCSDKLSASRIRSIECFLGITKSTLCSCYLGMPIIRGRAKASDFQFLLDKVLNCISGWKTRHLSQGGRATLIRHVLGSFPIHVLAASQVPLQLIWALEMKFDDFFWGWAEVILRGSLMMARYGRDISFGNGVSAAAAPSLLWKKVKATFHLLDEKTQWVVLQPPKIWTVASGLWTHLEASLLNLPEACIDWLGLNGSGRAECGIPRRMPLFPPEPRPELSALGDLESKKRG
ncbi:uncharacterized protein LOC131225060 [Magnolia sinica]|uniref:uncharacterized protein LOC131225060 n=1 Tax=Magnolia sinica TaxID=86752 RepID=UPI002658A12C|nr:uncharacterized protein LOC131225060 [Magnolia sinica]